MNRSNAWLAALTGVCIIVLLAVIAVLTRLDPIRFVSGPGPTDPSCRVLVWRPQLNGWQCIDVSPVVAQAVPAPAPAAPAPAAPAPEPAK